MKIGAPVKVKGERKKPKKRTAAKKRKAPKNGSRAEQAIDAINKLMKQERCMFSLTGGSLDVETRPTGLIALDGALGIAGLPKGRIIEVYGPESSGKTSLCLHFIAQAQRDGDLCALIDAEHATDPNHAGKIHGVDINTLAVTQPSSGEEALKIVEKGCEIFDLIVVDSVSALTPQAELDADMDKQQMGLQARMMSKAMRKIVAKVGKSGCTVIFINQVRMKIGVMFGNPETTSGGQALKFAASLRIRIGKAQTKIAHAIQECNISVVKNKLGAPYKKTKLLLTKKGFDSGFDLALAAKESGVLTRTGNSYSFKGKALAGSEANLRKFLSKPSKTRKAIKKAIRKAIKDGSYGS